MARAAVEVGAGFDAALLAAQLAGWQGQREEAENELAALALEAADDTQRGSVAAARLDNLVYHLGRIEDGLKIAEKSIDDPAWRDEIAARRAGALLVVGPAAAAKAALPLLERATGGALVWACLVAACSLPRTGKLSLTLEIAERGNTVQRTREQALDWYGVLPIYFQCDALAYLGDLEEAESIAAREYDAAVAGGWAEPQAFFAWQLTKVMRERGRVASAVRYGREAIALHRELGYPQYAVECTPHLAMALALAGSEHEAAGVLRPLCEAGATIPLFTSRVELYRARAWASAAGGDLPRARELLVEGAELGRHSGDRIGEATALYDLARFGHPAVAVDRLEAVAEEIEGSFGRTIRSAARQGWKPPVGIQQSMVDDRMLDIGDADGVYSAAVVPDYRTDPRLGDYRAAMKKVPGGVSATIGANMFTTGQLLEKLAPQLGDNPGGTDFIRVMEGMRGETLGGVYPPLTYKSGVGHVDTNQCAIPVRIHNKAFEDLSAGQFVCAPGWKPAG